MQAGCNRSKGHPIRVLRIVICDNTSKYYNSNSNSENSNSNNYLRTCIPQASSENYPRTDTWVPTEHAKKEEYVQGLRNADSVAARSMNRQPILNS